MSYAIKKGSLKGLDSDRRRRFEIDQLRALIEVQAHNAQSTERYLRIFGSRLSDERIMMLRRHLERLTSSVAEMIRRRDRLRHTPPVQLLMFDDHPESNGLLRQTGRPHINL